MRIVYHPLAAFVCRHSYFANGLARPLRMAPTAACLRLMQRHRCLLRNEPGGGVIHAGLDDAGLMAASLDRATPLSFTLTCDDPYFASYTATDWAPGSVVYYSNGASGAGVPSPQGERLLTGETLALKTRAFTHRFDAPQRGAALTVTRTSYRATVFAAPAPAGAFETLALDLRDLAEGRYALSIDGAPTLDFYLSDGDASGLWGVVELFGLGDLATDGAAPPAAVRYAVALAARETIWRYVIVGAGVAAGARIAVSGRFASKQTIAFKGPAPTQFGSRQAAAFESAMPIAAAERPADHYAIRLTISRADAGGEVTLALPVVDRSTPIEAGRGGTDGTATIVFSI
jgi:hypothetical protein